MHCTNLHFTYLLTYLLEHHSVITDVQHLHSLHTDEYHVTVYSEIFLLSLLCWFLCRIWICQFWDIVLLCGTFNSYFIENSKSECTSL